LTTALPDIHWPTVAATLDASHIALYINAARQGWRNSVERVAKLDALAGSRCRVAACI
jgi:hypothetical protein